MALERSVDLAPGDWFWATWRELMPLRKPAAPSFDRAGCCARLEKVPGASYEPGWSWARARIAPTLSEEEACFWLEAMLSSNASAHPDDAATRLATTPPAPTPTPAALVKQLTGERILLPNEFWLPLYNLFPMRDAVGLLLDCDDRLRRATKVDPWTLLTFGVTTTNLGIGFRSLVRPYLTAEEVADLRDAIGARVRLSDWPSQPEAPPPLAFMLAATLGLHGELEPLVESWPDRENASADPLHHLAPEIVFGLGSADAVQHHVRRLRMRLQKPEHARAWLAHTETSALDWLRDSILAQKRKTQAAPLARVLALVRAPEAAAPMVDLLLKSAAPEVGRQWLERYPGQSIPGLVPVAMGRGKAAEAARDLLQSFRRAGHGALIDQTITETAGAGERLHTTVTDPVDSPFGPLDAGSTPPWLQDCTEKPLLPRRPNWLRPGDLPPIILGRCRLSDAQEEAVLSALQRSGLDDARAPIPELREHADPVSLDAFAWRLYELWQQNGKKTRDRWALQAVGLLGGDGCALKLGPLAKLWREQLHHQNAAIALDCLAAIGSNTALLQLRNFTQIQRGWCLKDAAAKHLENVAKARGLTQDQLEDRLVPDCGLDASGTRTFDFGPRRFRLALGAELKPMVRDPDGKLRPDLPKPAAKDDAIQAAQAVAEWKLLKKQLGEILKRQAERLEQAMVHGRAWPASEFSAVFLQQPVMTLLARLLIWQAYDGAGHRAGCFRVAEDDTLTNVDDAPYTLGDAGYVRIPHPLHLTETERLAWGERLSDYELIPPFPQLGRPVCHPLPEELAATTLTRFDGIPCLAVGLADGLERRGWKRSDPVYSGNFTAHQREFPAAGLMATVSYDPGIFVAGVWASPEQTLTGCTFATLDDQSAAPIPLGKVDPVVFSEVAADLAAQTARRR